MAIRIPLPNRSPNIGTPSAPSGQTKVPLGGTTVTNWYHPPAPVAAPAPNNPVTNPTPATPQEPIIPTNAVTLPSSIMPSPSDTSSTTGGTGGGTGDVSSAATTATTPNEQIGNPAGQQAGLSFAQVENYWIQAGGSPQAASMAAAVADAESGLNASAQRTNPDGSTGVGLWLIPSNGTPPGSTDPLANARAAVQLSQGGTDWTQWCSTWSDNNCGENNGTYLGQGANALMSLAGQKPGASYNVFGSTPSSSGVGASTATSGMPGTTSGTSGKSSLLPFIVIIVITGAIIYFASRKSQTEATSGE